VKGYGHQMEGASRPLFFRGVATVTTKLLNAIQVNPLFFVSMNMPIYSLLTSQINFISAKRTFSKRSY
jgi:hypothetical protein